ncbi:MAG TPA: GntR family transcriptional regulator [Chloroflexota bacterium]|nr:GntR family transcriptional regulator [Chloroflexota bacterium]
MLIASETMAALAPYAATEPDEERLPQRAYQALRQAIRDLRLIPGQMVLEKDAAEALGISRTPMREALVRLEAEGLLRLVPRHGFAVAPLDPDGLRETYEILEGLEAVAVDLAAARATPEQLEQLDQSIVEQEVALEQDDLIAWLRADDRFHALILEASGNSRLRRFAGSFNDQLYRARLFTHRLRLKPVNSTEDHRKVARAIRAGDSRRARELHQVHRRRARDEIIGIVQAVSPAANAVV